MTAVKLVDMFEIVENTKNFILLEVIGERKDCIRTGILNGDEEMVRVTKGDNHTITYYYKNGNRFSHEWGIGGYTLVAEDTTRRKNAIVRMIENDLETPLDVLNCREYTDELPQSKAECKGRNATFKLMFFPHRPTDISIHKNGCFYGDTSSVDTFRNALKDIYEEVIHIAEYKATTGCVVIELQAVNRK